MFIYVQKWSHMHTNVQLCTHLHSDDTPVVFSKLSVKSHWWNGAVTTLMGVCQTQCQTKCWALTDWVSDWLTHSDRGEQRWWRIISEEGLLQLMMLILMKMLLLLHCHQYSCYCYSDAESGPFANSCFSCNKLLVCKINLNWSCDVMLHTLKITKLKNICY